jgi:nickel-type superoxide dismutase maturation protease
MSPLLIPGDRLVVWRAGSYRPGDVVAAHGPDGRLLVKRVVGADQAGLVLVGDNLDYSTDSRHFGPVPLEAVIGRVVYRYAPSHRAGRWPRAGG